MNQATIYKIILPKTKCELLLPTITDIKTILIDEENLFDMFILKQIDIRTETVDKNSKLYQTALKNKIVQVK